MAQTPSKMIALGSKIPSFKLREVQSDVFQSEKFGEKALLVIFMCNHCPYVLHLLPALVSLSSNYSERGLKVLGINSNDIKNYPEDSPEKMLELIKKFNINFPYLFDETQEVAKAFDAACTPDFFLYDSNRKLVYRGQFDDSRPKNQLPVTGRDLRQAIDDLLNGRQLSHEQRPSTGCNIKWKT